MPTVTADAPRYFFCHLQKTAGSSLIMRLRRSFGAHRVYPTHRDGWRLFRRTDGVAERRQVVAAVISVPYLLERWPERRADIRVVTGHFPMCTPELLGGGFRTFTVLRDPVARTLSYLRHRRRLIAEDRDKSLEQIYEEPGNFHGFIHNHMVKMLSLAPAEMTRSALTEVEFTPERLARAKACLETVDIVGVQEQFETFCVDLADAFGLDLGPPVVVNLTDPVDVPMSFRQRIARDNAMDIELYEAALARAAAPRRRVHVQTASTAARDSQRTAP